MYSNKEFLTAELQSIRDAGLFKSERVITSVQGAGITLADGQDCAEFLREQLPGAFVASRRRCRGKRNAGFARLRHVQRPFHLRHARRSQRT